VDSAAKPGVIGNYRVFATIGRGGMADVYLGEVEEPRRGRKLIAIKALRLAGCPDPREAVAMFLDEARLAGRLQHPNIVETYCVAECGGEHFIAMEYLDGQSLRAVQARLGLRGLPLSSQLRILAETARALHHAHELVNFDGLPLRVVHRDVSPHNVFLTYQGQTKVLDFGISLASDALHRPNPALIRGKADYIAPEQIRGDLVDRRADVFSLGVMLWETLTAMRFAGGDRVSDLDKMQRRLQGSEARRHGLARSVDGRLSRICERAIALDPRSRHATASEFAKDIEDYLTFAGPYPAPSDLETLLMQAFRPERIARQQLIERGLGLPESRPRRKPPVGAVFARPASLGGNGVGPRREIRSVHSYTQPTRAQEVLDQEGPVASGIWTIPRDPAGRTCEARTSAPRPCALPLSPSPSARPPIASVATARPSTNGTPNLVASPMSGAGRGFRVRDVGAFLVAVALAFALAFATTTGFPGVDHVERTSLSSGHSRTAPSLRAGW